MTEPLLNIADLHMEIRDRGKRTPILRGIDLQVQPGKVHGLVGESGAGKTMVGKVVLGIQPRGSRVTRGMVQFEGRDLLRQSEKERRRMMGLGISLIPQDPMTSLNPAFKIGGQITDVMKLHLDMDERAARERALSLLNDVHIRGPERVMGQYPHELSGGMRQRILIAIAFACRPKLIIADEPTTALDVTVQRQVLRLINDLQENFGTAILFITHDLGVVAKICHDVTVLHAGRVLEHGPVKQVVEQPAHPYTQALMKATPRYDRPGDALDPVPIELTRELLDEAYAYDREQGYG